MFKIPISPKKSPAPICFSTSPESLCTQKSVRCKNATFERTQKSFIRFGGLNEVFSFMFTQQTFQQMSNMDHYHFENNFGYNSGI